MRYNRPTKTMKKGLFFTFAILFAMQDIVSAQGVLKQVGRGMLTGGFYHLVNGNLTPRPIIRTGSTGWGTGNIGYWTGNNGLGQPKPAAELLEVPNGFGMKNPALESLEATKHHPFESLMLNTFEGTQPQWNSMVSATTSGGVGIKYSLAVPHLFRRLGFLTNEPLDSIGMKRLSNFRDGMANRVIGERVGHSRYENIEIKGNAMLCFAVVSDAQATIDLLKQFLNREYGGVNKLADNYAIMTCIMLGEEGESYLRKLAKQREYAGLTVSSGWAYVKNIMPDLELSDDLIGNYEWERIDANNLEEWKIARIIAQEKINQANKK